MARFFDRLLVSLIQTPVAATARIRSARACSSRIIDRLLVCLYLLIAIVPAVATIAKKPGSQVWGSIPAAKAPRWSWSAVKSEQFQHGFVEWFERYLGYRGYSVYIDNAALVHLFGETKTTSHAVIAEDGMLFHVDDFAFYSKRIDELAPYSQVEAFADKVAAAQVRLQKAGRSLLPLLVPSKTSLYPGFVPAGWRHERGEPRPVDLHVYEAYKRAFEARNVRYVDAHAILTTSSDPPDLLWGREARHWSYYAACLALRSVFQQHAALLGTAPIEYPCVVVKQPASSSHDDFDLLRLLNTWWARPTSWEVPTVVGLAPSAMSVAPRPDLLVVGTSFTGTLIRDAYRSGAFGSVDSFFYNKRHMSWPPREEHEIAAGCPDWLATVASKEVIVLELFETYLTPDNYASEFLDQLAPELDRVTQPPTTP